MGVLASVYALYRPLLEWVTVEHSQDGSHSAAIPQREGLLFVAPQHLSRPLELGLTVNPMDVDENDARPTPRRAASPRPCQAQRWKRDIATTQGQSDMGGGH